MPVHYAHRDLRDELPFFRPALSSCACTDSAATVCADRVCDRGCHIGRLRCVSLSFLGLLSHSSSTMRTRTSIISEATMVAFLLVRIFPPRCNTHPKKGFRNEHSGPCGLAAPTPGRRSGHFFRRSLACHTGPMIGGWTHIPMHIASYKKTLASGLTRPQGCANTRSTLITCLMCVKARRLS